MAKDDRVLIRHGAYHRDTDLFDETDAHNANAIRMAKNIQDWTWK